MIGRDAEPWIRLLKISILIPTRDRLPLLRRAIDSVLRLDDEDCEIVVSDNASAEPIGAYVESLRDTRIVYVRTDRPLAVTDNWNNALAHSSGDYVLMLGDDDAVLRSYFIDVRALIDRFERPEAIYHNALVYAYPGVVPDQPAGYLRSDGYAEFLRDIQHPVGLATDQARRVARAAVNFRARYGFNMQFVTVSRAAIRELSSNGPFFRSPFPDYYAMNHLFMRARTIVADPRPQVVIGVSPRSYGFFHNNRREQDGRSFLGAGQSTSVTDTARPKLLPGTNINDGWLGAMIELHAELGHPRSLKPNYRRYRMLQIAYVYQGVYIRETIDHADLGVLKALMKRRERFIYAGAFAVLRLLVRMTPTAMSRAVPSALMLIERQFPAWDPVGDDRRYQDISEVVANLESNDPERWQRPRQKGLRGALVRRLA